jgi:hypothetical protein
LEYIKLWDGGSPIWSGEWCKILGWNDDYTNLNWFLAYCCGHDYQDKPVFQFFDSKHASHEFLYDSWDFDSSILLNTGKIDITTIEEVKEVLELNGQT